MFSDDLPQGWRFQKIKELSETYAGGTPSRSVTGMFGGNIPWVKSSELNRDEISTTQERLTDFGYKSSSVKWVPANTPLIAMYGATAGVISWLKILAVTNQAVLAIPPCDDSVNPRWLYWVLKFYADKLIATVQGSGQPNLSKKLIDELEVGKPLLVAEQQKIADILDTIDNLITLTDHHIAKLKLAKAGLLHDLLTRGIDENGELRDPIKHPEQFKETEIGRIPRDWEVQSAKDVCFAVVDCKNRTPPITDDGYPVIRTTNVRNGEFICEDLLSTDYRSYIEWTRKGVPRVGDILITREAPVGEVCLLPSNLSHACLGQRMMMYQVNSEIIRNDFMLLSLLSDAVQSRLINIAGGSTVGHVRVGDIHALLVHVPPLKEQLRIVEKVKSVSQKINTKSRILEKLKLLKKGLMADLLTGRVRVNLDAIEEN